MRNPIFPVAILLLICTFQSGAQGPGTLQQPAPEAPREGSVYEAGPYPSYTAELTPGPGRDILIARCSTCHSVTYIPSQPPLSRAQWEKVIHKMVENYGMTLRDEDHRIIIDYLSSAYTPETRKKTR